jgi:signal transduction histidine kinase
MRFYYQPQDNFMEGDEGRISQVLHNLINNALKFSITVNTKLEDDNIIVSVKDNGQGINHPPNYFQNLHLNPFQELD